VVEMTSLAAMDMAGEIRYRDICISPDGLKIYASADMSSQNASYKGKILEYTYTGSVLAIPEEPGKEIIRNTKIELYPNPAHNILNVKSNSDIGKPLFYTLHDLKGKTILTGKSFRENFSLNIEALPAGVYVFKLYNAYFRQVHTQKFV